MRNSISVSVSPAVWIVLALAVLVMPLPWLTALFISSAVHELCHYTAVRMMGAHVTGLRFNIDGIQLSTTPMFPMQSAFCSLVGPVGALILLLFAPWLPRTALCAMVQTMYHLLPIYPLDGGRALMSLSDYFGWNRWVSTGIETAVLIGVVLTGGLFSVFAGLGLLPICLSAAVIFRTVREKFLANRS